MEKGSLIGLGSAVAGVFLSATLHGINIVVPLHGDRLDPHRVLRLHRRHDDLVPDGSTSNLTKYVQKVMKGDEEHSAMETITQIVKLTNRARSEGLLALEDEAKSIEDPFFRKGIEFAVDGTDPEALKKTLTSEIIAMKDRHKVGQGWFTQAGVFAPTFGIIGAVFGLMATMAQPQRARRSR